MNDNLKERTQRLDENRLLIPKFGDMLVDGLVYANRYLTEKILMIDPATGLVRGRIDTRGLEHTYSNVTNGIAYDPDTDRLFITGKRWQNVYQIELVELPPEE